MTISPSHRPQTGHWALAPSARSWLLAFGLVAALDCVRNLDLRIVLLNLERAGLGDAGNRIYLVHCAMTALGVIASILVEQRGKEHTARQLVLPSKTGQRLLPAVCAAVAVSAMFLTLVLSGIGTVVAFAVSALSISVGLGVAIQRASLVAPPRHAGVLIGGCLTLSGAVQVALMLSPLWQGPPVAGFVAIVALTGGAFVASWRVVPAKFWVANVRGHRFIGRVRRTLGAPSAFVAIVVVVVMMGLVIDLTDNVFYFGPSFAVCPFLSPMVIALGVVVFAAAGWAFDKFDGFAVVVFGFVVVLLGQSMALFAANPAFVIPYALLAPTGSYALQLVLLAWPFRLGAQFRQRDAMPQLGWAAYYICAFVVSGLFEVAYTAMSTVAYWALLVLSLAGVLAAGAAWAFGLREHPTTQKPVEDMTAASVAAVAEFHGLTSRQHQVLDLLAASKSNEAIASALVVTTATAKFHVKNVLDILRVSRREVPQYVQEFNPDGQDVSDT